MEQLLKSLFFFLPFMASVEAQIPDLLTAYRLPEQTSTLTESLVTLGLLAIRQHAWPQPANNKFLHVSSDHPFIIGGSEPVSNPHTLCQPLETSENRAWQCFGLESITSVALDTGQPLYLKTDPHQSIVLSYNREPGLMFPEYDLSDYRIFFKRQQAEREKILKITAKEMATNRLKIKIAGEVIDDDSSRRMHIAKNEGITVREQKDIEEEYKRRHDDAHTQSDPSSMEQLHLVDTDLCLSTTMAACREVLSKIVTSAKTESDTTRENTSAPSQEAAQGAPEGQERNHSREKKRKQPTRRWRVQQQIDRMDWYGRKGRFQKNYRPIKLKRLEKTPNPNHQQLLDQYLEGFHIMETPMDNFCWLHAIRLSSGQDVATLIPTLTDMLNNDLPGNEQAQATEHSAYLSRWMTAQGEENVQLVRQQLINKEWPDFNILLPLLSYLFKKTFVIVNLHASGLIDDQVFTYATSNDVRVVIVSEASAINTPEERVYLGLLSRNNHFVGIQPGTRNDNHSHSDPDCLNKFTESRAIESTISDSEIPTESKIEVTETGREIPSSVGFDFMGHRKTQKQPHLPVNQRPRRLITLMCAFEGCNYRTDDAFRMRQHKKLVHRCDYEDCNDINCDINNLKTHELTLPPAIQDPNLLCDHEGCNYAAYYEPNLRRHKLIHRLDLLPRHPM